MGKQLNVYLNEQESKRLLEIASKECRRPHEQARWLLRQALGIASEDSTAIKTQNGAGVHQDLASAVP